MHAHRERHFTRSLRPVTRQSTLITCSYRSITRRAVLHSTRDLAVIKFFLIANTDCHFKMNVGTSKDEWDNRWFRFFFRYASRQLSLPYKTRFQVLVREDTRDITICSNTVKLQVDDIESSWDKKQNFDGNITS